MDEKLQYTIIVDNTGAPQATKSVADGLDAVEASAARASEGLKASQATLDSLSQGLFAFGTAASVTLTTPLAYIASIGIGFDAMQEQAQIAFGVMLGDGQKAKQFIEELKDFAAKTPFEFPDMTKAAQMLMAFGFAAKDVIPIMTAVGDAVSALGGGPALIDQIVQDIGRINSTGHITARELNELTMARIPMLDMLSKALGKTGEQIHDMIEKRLIDSNTALNILLNGMEERFPGMMDKQSRSFLGLLSTLKDIGRFVAGDVMEPFFDAMTAGFRRVIPLLTIFQDYWKSLDPRIKEAVLAFGTFLALIGPIALMAAGLLAVVSAVGFLSTGLTAAVAASGPILMAFGAVVAVTALLSAGVAALIALFTYFPGVASAAWSAIVGIVDPILTQIIRLMELLWNTSKTFWDQWGALITQALSAAAGIVAAEMSSIGNIFGGVLQLIVDAVQIFGGALTGNWKMVWDGLADILGMAMNRVKDMFVLGIETAIMRPLDALLSLAQSAVQKLAAIPGFGSDSALANGLSEARENLEGHRQDLQDLIPTYTAAGGAVDKLTTKFQSLNITAAALAALGNFNLGGKGGEGGGGWSDADQKTVQKVYDDLDKEKIKAAADEMERMNRIAKEGIMAQQHYFMSIKSGTADMDALAGAITQADLFQRNWNATVDALGPAASKATAEARLYNLESDDSVDALAAEYEAKMRGIKAANEFTASMESYTSKVGASTKGSEALEAAIISLTFDGMTPASVIVDALGDDALKMAQNMDKAGEQTKDYTRDLALMAAMKHAQADADKAATATMDAYLKKMGDMDPAANDFEKQLQLAVAACDDWDTILKRMGPEAVKFADSLKEEGRNIPPLTGYLSDLQRQHTLTEEATKKHEEAIRSISSAATQNIDHVKDLNDAILYMQKNGYSTEFILAKMGDQIKSTGNDFTAAGLQIGGAIGELFKIQEANERAARLHDDIMNFFGRIYDDVISGHKSFFDSILDIASEKAKAIGRTMFQEIGDALFSPLQKTFDEQFRTIFSVGGMIHNLLDPIGQFINDTVGTWMETLIGGPIRGISAWLTQSTASIGEWLGQILGVTGGNGTHPIDSVSNDAKAIIAQSIMELDATEAVEFQVVEMSNRMGTEMNNFANVVHDDLGSTYTMLINSLYSIYSGEQSIYDMVLGALNQANALLVEIRDRAGSGGGGGFDPTGVMDTLNYWGHEVFDTLTYILNNLENGLTETIGWLIGILRQLDWQQANWGYFYPRYYGGSVGTSSIASGPSTTRLEIEVSVTGGTAANEELAAYIGDAVINRLKDDSGFRQRFNFAVDSGAA